MQRSVWLSQIPFRYACFLIISAYVNSWLTFPLSPSLRAPGAPLLLTLAPERASMVFSRVVYFSYRAKVGTRREMEDRLGGIFERSKCDRRRNPTKTLCCARTRAAFSSLCARARFRFPRSSLWRLSHRLR